MDETAKCSPTETVPSTVGMLDIPQFTEHDIGDIPIGSQSERWELMNWREARQTVQDNKAISIPVSPREVDTARRFAVERLGIEDGNPGFLNDVETRYDLSTQRLWAWLAKSSPWIDSVPSDTIG